MESYFLSHLDVLEAEAIHIMREVAAEFRRPVMLFSGGKDSICMLRLAEKAFRPAHFPFPLLHIDTGHNFPEVIDFRDRRAAQLGERLIVRTVQDAIEAGIATEPTGGDRSRNWLQIPTLLNAIEEFKFDAAFGGARRDEEKSRAKERVFSFRDEFGQWDPRNQRPELWNLYNTKIAPGQHIRVFPLSNWTELDIWQYIEREALEIPTIYFSHSREMFLRDGLWMSHSDLLPLRQGETVLKKTIRFRTVGDIISTAAVESQASTVREIIEEIAATRIAERGARADDRRSETAMEDRKREGYF
ncbi:MAG: sulfate adenylyltransferase subunit CysD [Acidobacteria bacterium]|nr:sulfate adenylyltransferase subunit CysD [Acidobacteriota bacterium]MCI0718363.1 sulfate adenylyltransferase subunit CysD [Acidobacteriota bacterium]